MSGLLDFFQSASNTVADNVAGPVDLISWGLRKAGVPVGPAPVGGSEWMRQQGLTRPVQQSAASLAGETAGLLAPTMIAAKAPQIAGGLLQMADNAMAPRTLNPETGAIVWHGSPHKFDKFDSGKIGTGEGAQAYGHGLYLAENKNIAQGYADVVGRQHGQQWLYGEDKVSKPGDAGSRWALAGIDWLKKTGGDKDAAISAIKRNWEEAGHSIKGKDFRELKKWITDADFAKVAPDNNLYKVDLPDEHIAKMLDWDKPLSQQAPEVLAGLKKLDKKYTANQSDVAGLIRHIDANSAMMHSDKLRQAGIPGIRYLDGGSRGAGTGTSNYVIFPQNEDILTILERNGKGLLGQ